MRIQTWTLFITLEEEIPIEQFGSYCQDYPIIASKNVSSLPYWNLQESSFTWDTIYNKRSRTRMAKVKMKIDLTIPRPRHMWIGLHNEDDTIGTQQPVEYENIPPYCE